MLGYEVFFDTLGDQLDPAALTRKYQVFPEVSRLMVVLVELVVTDFAERKVLDVEYWTW